MEQNNLSTSVLIGNGFNLAKSIGPSWFDLLNNLGSKYDINIEEKLKNPFRPFPIAFEEIVLKNNGSYENEIRKVKENIADEFIKIPKTPLHEAIIRTNVKNILTTNYDYAFEKVIIEDFGKGKSFVQSETREYVHSLKRKKSIGFKNIWHIHGELFHKLKTSNNRYNGQTILIGFDQYNEYLKIIRDYLNDSSNMKRLSEDPNNIVSWVDLFFVSNLTIIGLSYDISETHLWSILNFRAKSQKLAPKYPNLFQNEITYLQIGIVDAIYLLGEEKKQEEMKTLRNKAKCEMLESFGVKVIKKSFNNFVDSINYYHEFINAKLR